METIGGDKMTARKKSREKITLVDEPEKRLSILMFARSLGIDQTTVRQAIKSGKINAGFQNKKIIPSVAIAEWRRNHSDTAKASPALRLALGLDEMPFAGSAREVIPDETIMDMPRAEAERMKSVFAALAAKQEYETRRGELVPIKAVYDAQFEFAANIRRQFELMPAKIIHRIRGADTDHAARLLMEREIEKVLQELSGIDSSVDEGISKHESKRNA